MSVRYVLAPQAALDLVEIWRYIKNQASLAIADRVESAIRKKIVFSPEPLMHCLSRGYVPDRIMWPDICLAECMKAVKNCRQFHCGAEELFDQVNRSPPTSASDSTLESSGSKRTS